jgi:YegS/Rv2252/BmrU family lipid kinase
VRTCVIFNPAARGEKARRFKQQLGSHGGVCAIKLTDAPGAARRLACEAVREGFETIAAAGGDGTVNEVLNGIADHPEGIGRARLAVLPIGTVNVFARELGLPLKIERAWDVLCRGNEISIDLPSMRFETDRGPESRYFVQMAGCGLDARAVAAVSWELKKKIGQLAYVWAGLKALRAKPSRITVRHGSSELTGELVIIGNGRYYGGQIPVFRQADFRDGLLDVCVFPRITWLVVARYFWAFLSERLLRPGSEPYLQADHFELASDSPELIELDGENVGRLPARCAVRRQALRVVVPR